MLEDASETSTPVYRAPELFDIDPHMEDLSIDEAVDVWVSLSREYTLQLAWQKARSFSLVPFW